MPVKILVADDSATMRQVMEMTFAGEDAEVVTVDSGDAAIQRAKDFRPDVVFADASMATDGYAVSQAIKNDPATARTAVILLASQHNPVDEARAGQAGVDDHVLKPFDSQQVIDKVGQVLGRPRATAAAAAAPAHAGAGAAASRQTTGGAPPPPPPRPTAGGPTQAPSNRPAHKATVAFGAPVQRPAPAPPPAPPPGRPVLELADEEPVPARPAPTPAAAPVRPTPARAPASPSAAAAAATGNGSSMAQKLEGLGLTEAQIQGVLALSREVIEQVVWEVVPDLAETIIREEIKRLTAE